MQSDPYKHHHTMPQDMWYVVEMSRDKSLDNFRNLPKRHQIIIQIKELMKRENVNEEELAQKMNIKTKELKKILNVKKTYASELFTKL